MRSNIVFHTVLVFIIVFAYTAVGRQDIWVNVRCKEVLQPDDCDFENLAMVSVDELDRCAPARLELSARNYFLAASGRKTTYKDNKDAFDRIRLQPNLLSGVSTTELETSVLGQKLDFPIGLSPVGVQKLAYPEGEKATVQGLSGMRTVMILSSYSTTLLEEVAEQAPDTVQLWMQTNVFLNRTITVDIVQRAERSGFKAIVLTIDSHVQTMVSCDARNTFQLPEGARIENLNLSSTIADPSISYKDIRWLKKITKLPIIVKGLLSGEDAKKVASAGASAILVSNHGGRELDGSLATIDALPGVVRGLRGSKRRVEVYLDGGVRSGIDVFKALAAGASMVFVGRPQIWGLVYGGPNGVRSVIRSLASNLNETMFIAGASKVSDINSNFLLAKDSSKYSPFHITEKH